MGQRMVVLVTVEVLWIVFPVQNIQKHITFLQGLRNI